MLSPRQVVANGETDRARRGIAGGPAEAEVKAFSDLGADFRVGRVDSLAVDFPAVDFPADPEEGSKVEDFPGEASLGVGFPAGIAAGIAAALAVVTEVAAIVPEAVALAPQRVVKSLLKNDSPDSKACSGVSMRTATERLTPKKSPRTGDAS